MAEIKYRELPPEGWMLLLKAFDIELHKEKCHYCKDQLKFGKVSFFPSVDGKREFTLTCDSALCISSFMEDEKDMTAEKKNEEKVIDKHLNKIESENDYIAFELDTAGKIVIPNKLKDKVEFCD